MYTIQLEKEKNIVLRIFHLYIKFRKIRRGTYGNSEERQFKLNKKLEKCFFL